MTDTLSSGNVSTKQQQIATLARNFPERVFSSLHHYLDYDWLLRAWELTRKNAAAGVDGQTADKYAEHLEQNLQSLLSRIKSGSYRAPAIRRIYIPKSDGQRRPLGLPTFEDKIVQRAVVMVMEPIYEQIFSSCSFGFRPGRSAHQAYMNASRLQGFRSFDIDCRLQIYIRPCCSQCCGPLCNTLTRALFLQRALSSWPDPGLASPGLTCRCHHYGCPRNLSASTLL
ncbi:hypothetical protein AU892_26200 [Salmonella enterica subsp. diarizonae]|nr:hypothetical protein [Salmonella enterica subsp. diarizonae]